VSQEFKEDKNYMITVSHTFKGEFKRFQVDPRTQEKIAVFATGGSDRNGVYERAVPMSNIVSSELTKT
jgi:hypothetical protein